MYRALGMALAVWAAGAPAQADEYPTNTHVHALAFTAGALTVATHDGVFIAAPGGTVEKVPGDGHAFAAKLELHRRPAGLYGVSAMPGAVGRVFAATEHGLLVTGDGGSSWATVFRRDRPVTAVLGTADGSIFAYAPGEGLLKARDPATAFRRLGDPVTGAVVHHIAVDPRDSRHIAVADDSGVVAVSADDGRTWRRLGGH